MVEDILQRTRSKITLYYTIIEKSGFVPQQVKKKLFFLYGIGSKSRLTCWNYYIFQKVIFGQEKISPENI